VTIRRYAPMRPSRGTVIPSALRQEVLAADQHQCVGPRVGMAGECFGAIELDHIRASHGMGMKSETERGNLVSLCSTHHRDKTDRARKWRSPLLSYIGWRDDDTNDLGPYNTAAGHEHWDDS
jgi:5-methylcytosine-specific restriction endonuclease McrA